MPVGARLVPELPLSSEHHCDAVFVGRGDYVRVAHRTAGLNDRGTSRVSRLIYTVTEWDEGVGAKDVS